MTRIVLFGLVSIILILFLVGPLCATLRDAIWEKDQFTLVYLLLTISDPYLRGLLLNSLWLALLVTVISTLIALPAASTLARWTFPGRGMLTMMLMSPLVIPPFVGALGLRHILGRFGPINMLLIQLGISESGLDLLGSGRLFGVVVVETLHFFPLLLLMLLGPMAMTRGTVEEAAAGLGASPFLRARRVLFPMIQPSLVAGMLIVFLWSLTDLGAPLIFDYRYLLPVKIYDLTGEIGASPVGSALVIVLLAVVLGIFVLSRWVLGRQVEWRSVRDSASRPLPLSGWRLVGKLVWLVPLGMLAVLPHVAILVTSVADRWFLSVMPESWSAEFYAKTLRDPLSLGGLANSLWMSACATAIDVILALVIVHLVVRRKVKGGWILDLGSSLPLAIPGVLLAFGYLSLFLGTSLSPMGAAAPILVIAYATRRLPYMVRSIGAGASAIPATWEEAARSLGSSTLRVWRRVTIPLLFPSILAGAIMVFILSLLEVGCSLILAFREADYPLTKSLWALFVRVPDGSQMASALGVLGMLLLALGLLVAARILGRRIGDLFRPL
jgi:iron(III) transport system permease protein